MTTETKANWRDEERIYNAVCDLLGRKVGVSRIRFSKENTPWKIQVFVTAPRPMVLNLRYEGGRYIPLFVPKMEG